MESCSSQNRSTGGIDDKMSLVPLSHEMNEARSHEAALPEEDGKNQGQTENDTPFHTLRPPALKEAGAAISPHRTETRDDNRGAQGVAAQVWSCSLGSPQQLSAPAHRGRQDGATELVGAAGHAPSSQTQPHPLWSPLARHGVRVLLVLPTRYIHLPSSPPSFQLGPSCAPVMGARKRTDLAERQTQLWEI